LEGRKSASKDWRARRNVRNENVNVNEEDDEDADEDEDD